MLAKADSSELYQLEANRYWNQIGVQDTDEKKLEKQYYARWAYAAARRHEIQYLGPIPVILGGRSVTLQWKPRRPCYAFLIEGELTSDYYFETSLSSDMKLRLTISYDESQWHAEVYSHSRLEAYRTGYSSLGATPQESVDNLTEKVLEDIQPFHSIFTS